MVCNFEKQKPILYLKVFNFEIFLVLNDIFKNVFWTLQTLYFQPIRQKLWQSRTLIHFYTDGLKPWIRKAHYFTWSKKHRFMAKFRKYRHSSVQLKPLKPLSAHFHWCCFAKTRPGSCRICIRHLGSLLPPPCCFMTLLKWILFCKCFSVSLELLLYHLYWVK